MISGAQPDVAGADLGGIRGRDDLDGVGAAHGADVCPGCEGG